MRLHLGFAVLAVALTASLGGAQEPAVKPVRVLLVTSGANREFQFAQLVLARAEQAKQVELAVYPTAPLPGEVPAAKMKHFPNLLRPADRVKPEEKAYNLNSYDVVIAVDVNWTQVEPESLVLLQKWVERGGGLVVSAGAIHTPTLARARADDEVLQPLRELVPVIFHKPDNQPAAPVNRIPVHVKFKETKPAVPFLKLDPNGKTDLAGWDDFFDWSKEKDDQPRRGFYYCFPVESVKKGAVTLATFQAQDGKEQSWLAMLTVGKGRVIWIGSPEVWRLRAFNEAFHERFWLEMTRHVAATGRPQ
jgi:hypothetical protein